MAAYLHPSEKAKVDDVLRLPGLNFHQSDPVIGKKNLDLLIALGAIDTKRGRAGNQITVIRRLAFLYQTVLLINKENPDLDINSDRFYAAALLSISEKYRDVYKNVTPQSFRHVIELYRKAFARSGFKVISMSTETQNPVGDRARLEELVKEWMMVRGAARRASTTEKKQVFHLFQDVNFPQQKPDETLDGYMLRLKHEFNQLNEDQQAVNKTLSYVSDQKGERVAQLSEQNREYEELLYKRLDLLDKKEDQIDGYKRRLDKNHHQIAEYERLLHQRRESIDRQYEEINEYKIRVASMQQVIDQYGDMLDNHEDLVSAHAELDENLTEATKMQVEVMRLELHAAQRQDYVNHNLDEVIRGHEEIGQIQHELSQEVQRTILMQGAVADRQDEVIRKQAQIMARQMDVMDSVRAMLNKYNQG